jgi:hypothetical protein
MKKLIKKTDSFFTLCNIFMVFATASSIFLASCTKESVGSIPEGTSLASTNKSSAPSTVTQPVTTVESSTASFDKLKGKQIIVKHTPENLKAILAKRMPAN